jgi:uncharacterized membrane protein YkvA (DUF1232 family)
MKRRAPFSFLNELFVLYYAITDKRTPLHAKLAAIIALIYLVSPIDLIPDFIPVAGYLDDLVIVPLLLHVAFRLLPDQIKNESWAKAKSHLVKLRILFAVVVLFILGIMAAVFLLVKELLHHF